MAGLVLGACQSAYQPEPVAHPRPLAERAFDSVLEAVRATYPRVVLADRQRFRIQTAWHGWQRGDRPGHRRATVYRDADGGLRVVVEVRFVGLDLLGRPDTTPVQGDRELERELARTLAQVLGGPRT
ncbi:MAG: hypothetical protein H6837_11440 [Planctomycetes bacterium]|nr:hypothetical protein [Planctomycetota bacterium]